MTEGQLQKEILDWVRQRNNGLGWHSRNPPLGTPDLVIPMPEGTTLWVELKRPDGKGTVDLMQYYQLDKLQHYNHPCFQIDNAEHFKEIYNELRR